MLKQARSVCDFEVLNQVLLLFGDEAQTFLFKGLAFFRGVKTAVSSNKWLQIDFRNFHCIQRIIE